MKNWIKILAVFLALGLIASAGVLGLRSSRAEAEEEPAAPATVAAARCDVEQTVTAPGRLVDTRQKTMQMPANGSLAEVLVRPGERVEPGQVLARLANRAEFEAQVSAAQLELLSARQELAALYQGAGLEAARQLQELVKARKAAYEAERRYNSLVSAVTDEQVTAAKTALDLARKRLDQAKKGSGGASSKLDPASELDRLEKQAIEAQQRYDTLLARYRNTHSPAESMEITVAEAEMELARSQLTEAGRRYQEIKDGPAPLEVDLAKAKVSDRETRLAAAQAALANVEITAPFAGVVLEVKANPGEALAAGASLITLSDPQALEVEASVIEEDLPKIASGQPADLFFDALPELELRGQIARIVPQRLSGDRPLYAIYITLDSIPEKLVAGMTSDASIKVAGAADVLCLPRSIVRASAGDTATVTVWAGDHTEKRTVTLGLRGDVNIEIRSGLKEGEQVVR